MPYLSKMKGGAQSPPRVSISEILWSWIGSFCGNAAVASVHFYLLEPKDLIMVIGSFGASRQQYPCQPKIS